ncbi:MAG: phosphoribosylaminoimidazolesuccinocarboxamide synthase [Streptosporangiaceae bacterium]
MKHLYSGKVRDLYETGDGTLLIVASDRISAFDHVLEPPIPDKGAILTQLSLWWCDQLADVVPNHLIDAPVPAQFAGRAMTCRRLSMVEVECVARGYLAGSGLTEYRASGTVCGIPLPAGLTEGSQLPEPIFTPATKAPLGSHDENIPMSAVAALAGEQTAAELQRITLAVYRRGAELAAARGIIVADTKIELGFDQAGELRLADEVLTPDSSRFWPADEWQPGRPQPSFDKQYVRDWLTSPQAGWDPRGAEPPPVLPAEVVARTREKYKEAYQRITGLTWEKKPEEGL